MKGKYYALILIFFTSLLALILLINIAGALNNYKENKEIIDITKAEHLDSSRIFLSDIYNEVNNLDEIWTETIHEGEYIRVSFEELLNNTKDITIYPRIISGNPIIEVYEQGSNEILGEFSSLDPEEYNTFYLTNLLGEQGTFDLKVVGGSIEINHIIDPVVYPNGLATATAYGWQEKTVRIDSGELISVWIDSASDLWCSNSLDNGTRWSNIRIANAVTYITPTIVTNGTRVVVFAVDNFGGENDIVSSYSDNGCLGFGLFGDVNGLNYSGNTSYNFTLPTAAVGSDNKISLCSIANADDLFFGYSNDFGASFIEAIVIDDTNNDECDIEVDSTGEVWIVTSDRTAEDIFLFNSSNNFNTFNTTTVELSTVDTYPSIAIGTNDEIYLTWTNTSNNLFKFANSSDGTTWSIKGVQTDNSIVGDVLYSVIKVNNDTGEIYIFYDQDVNSAEYAVFLANSSDGGATWTNTWLHNASGQFTLDDAYYTTPRGSKFPVSNRISDRLDYLYSDDIGTSREVLFKSIPDFFPELNSSGIFITTSTNPISFGHATTRIYDTNQKILSDHYLTQGTNSSSPRSWQKLRCLEQREECILLWSDTQNNINFEIYDISQNSWKNYTLLASATPDDNTLQFDVECEDLSGECLLIYRPNIVDNRSIAYRVYNDSGLSIEYSFSITDYDGILEWAELYPKINTNEIMLGIEDSNLDIYALLWNGTENNFSLSTKLAATYSGPIADRKSFDFAWEGSSGQGLFVFGNTTDGLFGYSFNDYSWTNEGRLYNLVARPYNIEMCGSDPLMGGTNHDYIGIIIEDQDTDLNGMVWNGTRVEAGNPTEDATGNALTATQYARCMWESQSKNQSVFIWVDTVSTTPSGGSYTIGSGWDFASFEDDNRTGMVTFSTTDIDNIMLYPEPSSDEILVLGQDSGEDVNFFFWNGTWFDNTTSNYFNPLEVISPNSAFMSQTFDYVRYAEGYNPTYNLVEHNSTSANQISLFSINVSDETALHPNGQYIFSTNNTGEWINESAINFTSTPSWANVSKILNSTEGMVVGYRWYFNDSAGNTNSTPVYTLTTTSFLDCGTLDTANTLYTLTQNVSSQGTCFTIAEENITLDCNGYFINYSINGTGEQYGVYSNQFNTTIKNCNISLGNSTSSETSRHGIYFYDSDNGLIFNNTLICNSSDSYGVYFQYSDYNNILNNTISSYEDYALDINLDSSYNNISYNIINSTNTYSLHLQIVGDNNFLSYNILPNGGIHFQGYSNNTIISNMTIPSIMIMDSGHNFTVIDSIITEDVYMGGIGDPGEWNFTNVTDENGDRFLIIDGDNSDGVLNIRWYLDTNVTYSNGTAIEGANVSIYDVNNNLLFTENTSSQGLIERKTLLEYSWYNDTTVYSEAYYTPHTINVTKSGFIINSTSYNLTELHNVFANIFLEYDIPDTTYPNATINSPTGTFADITPLINISVSETSNIWYNIDNGTNITLCNNCNSSQNKFLYAEEGEHIIYIFANDSAGNLNSSIYSSFTIDMNNNYYDSFNDNSSLYSKNNVIWNQGNITFSAKYNYLEDPNLVSVYEFQDIGNLGIDTKGNNNMSSVGDPAQNNTVPPGFEGYSIQLDGDDQICNHSGFTFNPSTNHTMCFWVMKTGFSNDGNVFAQNCVYDTWDNDAEYIFTANNCYNQESVGIEGVYYLDQWAHICQTYDSTTDNMTFYINGDENSSHVFTNPIEYHTDQAWCIGGCDGGCWMTGNVFQPMWFERILNSEEINDIYSQGGFNQGNFTSYPINTTQNITEITNITWTETNTDLNNNITVEISADGGTTWYNATSGSALGQTFAGENNSLVYRVIFSTNSSTKIAISDMNISWSNEEEIVGENACGTLDVAGQTYTLTQNVSSQGTCFTITQPNITLDCNGFWINYSTDGGNDERGIYSNQFNTTIKNCNIVDGNWTSTETTRYGIYFDGSSNSNLENNNINLNNSPAIYFNNYANFNLLINNTVNSAYVGIFLYQHSSYNILIDNNVTSSVTGLYLYGNCSHNNLSNNIFSSSGDGEGIYIASESINNLFINNNASSNTDWAIRVYDSEKNLFFNQIAITSTASGYSRAIYLSGANHTLFRDCKNISGVDADVYVYENSLSINNTFINCSYDLNKEYVNGPLNDLKRKWYYQAYVNNTAGSPMVNANILAYNTTGQLEFTTSTNSSGYISRQEITEYINTGGTISYFSNYTINATFSGYETDSNILNITETQNKLDDVFTLDGEGLQCGTLSTIGNTYILTSNVSSQGTCFLINRPNITLDCNGYWINYSINGSENTYGIYSAQFNTTVKNCNIVDGNWTSSYTTRYGVILTGSDNSTMYNNYVNVNNSNAIYLAFGNSFNNITKNTGTSYSNRGIYFSGDNSSFTDNIAISNSTHGFDIGSGSVNNIFINNSGTSVLGNGITVYSSNNNTFINCTGTSSNNGVGISNSVFNIFEGLTAKSLSGFNRAISLSNSNNSLFRDCGNISGYYSVYAAGGSVSINNTLINCSYLVSGESIASGNELIRKWYYQAYVNDTSGSAVSGANISAYNSTGDLQFTTLTNSSGYIDRQEVIEYVNTGGTRSFWSNYTINATLLGYEEGSNILNFTITQNKIDDIFTLSEDIIPGVNACGTLDTANTLYTLTQNVSSQGTCFTIAEENITLDCNGFWINYSTDGGDNERGIYSNQFNTTIKNCNIVDGNEAYESDSREGIYLYADNSTLFNNSITTNHTAGIYLPDGSDFNNLTKNNAMSGASGIVITGSNNTLNENIGNSTTAAAWYSSGIDIAGNENTLINNTARGEGYALYISGDNCIFTNNTAISTGIYAAVIFSEAAGNILTNQIAIGEYTGIDFSISANNTIKDCENINGEVTDIYTGFDAGSVNNTLLNCSYNTEDVNAADGQIIRKWYYLAYTNYSNGTLATDVNVTAYNTTGQLQFTAQTNSSGHIPRQEIIEYINIGGTPSYYSNYTIFANLTGTSNATGILNLTATQNKMDDFLTLGAPPIDCGILDSENTVYTLTQNVTSTGMCFNITAQNITLDCNGFWINYSTAGTASTNGVYSNKFNTTIRNCNIVDGAWGDADTDRDAIFYDSASNGLIINNFINTSNSDAVRLGGGAQFNNLTLNKLNSDAKIGLDFVNANNNTVDNNNITSISNIALELITFSSDNNITNNLIVSTSNFGADISSSSSNNLFIENEIMSDSNTAVSITGVYNNSFQQNLFLSNDSAAIDINSGSAGNLFLSNNFTGDEFGIFLQESSNNLFKDCIQISGSTSVYNNFGTSSNITFVNCSYAFENIQDAGSELTRKWYYMAYVNYSNGNLATDVNVTAYNTTGDLQFTAQTNASGHIVKQELTDYVNLGGTRTFYSNYTIFANLTGTSNATGILNLTTTENKMDDFLTLGGEDIISPAITINYPTGTIADITPLINVSSSESGTIWYGIDDGENITLCNSCTSSQNKFLYLEEGSHTIYVFANDSSGNNGTSSNSFTIDMNYNYYDNFNDNSSIFIDNDITWYSGTINFTGGFNYLEDPDLVSIYLFENVSALGQDYKGINNFTDAYSDPTQNTTVPSGLSGYSIHLDGNDEVCNVASFNASQNHTACWWSYPSALAEETNQFAQTCYYDTWTTGTTGTYQWRINNCGSVSQDLNILGVLHVGEWTQICQTYDSSSINRTVYIDGEYNTSMGEVAIEYDGSQQWCIGGFHGGGYWLGNIYKPMWFDRVLSSDEILSIYNGEEGSSSGNFTSYAINTTENITSITNVTWTELNTDAENNITVEVSADGGTTWYAATSGSALGQTFTGENNSIVYRVIFSGSKTVGLSDMNLSWSSDELIPGENVCGTLDSANTLYTLTQNVSSTGTCFEITAENVTLDCNGFWINYSIGGESDTVGIYSDQFNTTIRNCNIIDGNWTSEETSRRGIEFQGNNNLTIYNNFVNTNNSNAISIGGGNFANITNNTGISINGNGIFLATGFSTGIDNIAISNSTHGLDFASGAYNNTFINNTAISYSGSAIMIYYSENNTLINCTGTSTNYLGIEVQGGLYNNISYSNGSSIDSEGIRIWGETLNSYFLYNTFTSVNDYGCDMGEGHNNLFIGNTIYSFGESGIAIFSPSSNNTFINNTFNSSSAEGLVIYEATNNTFIDNFAMTIASNYPATWIYNSLNNNLINHSSLSVASESRGEGLEIRISNNTIIRDCINISGGDYDVYLQEVSINNTFINCSYDVSKENVDSGNELIRKWYYQAYVNDTSGSAVSGANISAYNSTGDLQFTTLTNSSGYIDRQEVIEYVNTGGTRSFWSNYTINATLTGYEIESNILNITETQNKIDDVFALNENLIPGENACGTLDSEGHTYTLTQNVTSTGMCFNITAQNITLDCNGFWINYSTDGGENEFGVYTNQFNTTIKNCNIVDGSLESSDAGRYGILLVNYASNGTVYNNNIITGYSAGIIFYNEANYNNISSNNISTIEGYGIYSGLWSDYNLFINNKLTTGDRSLYFEISSYNTFISNNATGTGGAYFENCGNNLYINNNITAQSTNAITIYTSPNNTLINNTAISNDEGGNGITIRESPNISVSGQTAKALSSGGYAIDLYDQDNTIIRDCINITGYNHDVHFSFESTNVTFINCSYDIDKEYVDAGSELTRKWYYQAYVNYSNGTEAFGANISAYNSTEDLQFTTLTNSSGYIDRQEVIEYVNTGGTRSFWSNYTINATIANYGDSNTLNFTVLNNKLDDFFTLEELTSCSCPGLNLNWELDMSEYCNITVDCNLGTGNISFIDMGETRFNATISAANMKYPSTGQTLFISSKGVVNIG